MIFFEKKKQIISKDWIPSLLQFSLEESGFNPDKAIRLKHNSRAKRLSLRMNVKQQCVVLTFPVSATLKQAQDFIMAQQGWILKQLSEANNQIIEFKTGLKFPIMGIEHEIVSTGKLRGLCYREDGKLYVSGNNEHISRRVTDYLKKEARFEISNRARDKAKALNKKISKIRIADTTSRWGSCSSNGTLSFSWRLILAPEDKLDYVVAHEVAHLEHMNHGKDFWQLCSDLTNANVTECRQWFRKSGRILFCYK